MQARSEERHAAVELRGVDVAPAPGVRGAVLRGLTLRIAPGEQVAVIGASGAGKTTLLLALAAALPPLAGELCVLGQQPARLRGAALQRLRARLFLAPQVPPLPPRQRVVTAVLAARLPHLGLWRSLRMLWRPRLDAHEAGRAQAALAALQLPDKLWHRVDRLSGGERQRVGLARALVSDAALWLIDEPLSALDPARARSALDALQLAARQSGRTLVCSLHQVALARECFPRVLALQGGRLVYDGPASGLDDARLTALYGPDWQAAAAVDDRHDDHHNDTATAPAPGAPVVLPETLCR